MDWRIAVSLRLDEAMDLHEVRRRRYSRFDPMSKYGIRAGRPPRRMVRKPEPKLAPDPDPEGFKQAMQSALGAGGGFYLTDRDVRIYLPSDIEPERVWKAMGLLHRIGRQYRIDLTDMTTYPNPMGDQEIYAKVGGATGLQRTKLRR